MAEEKNENKTVTIEGEEMDFKINVEPTSTEEEPKKESFLEKHANKKLQDRIEELEAQVQKLEEENKKAKNDYFKAYADADNLKKRLQAEAESTRKYRIQSFAQEVLPVIDNLERALAANTTDETLHKGVQMTYDQLMNALAKEGVTVVDCLNQPFDPNYHHAIMQEKVDGVESNIVVEVLQKGYMLKDRILRAALVKVSE